MHTTAAEPYKSNHKVRFVTATSLFDGHDASTNIIRRILQASGAEVIHLGHNRSVEEIVTAAIQEDAQGIAAGDRPRRPWASHLKSSRRPSRSRR